VTRLAPASGQKKMHDLWMEFGKVAAAHMLAVASPGPDFAIVLRQSLTFGRRTAIWTSIGIGTAILLHVGYSLLGIGLLLKSSEVWFTALKYAGAAYLTWLGIRALKAKPRAVETGPASPGPEVPSGSGAFVTGFLTNALNPKVTLFFVALFVTVISPETPKIIQLGYGVWMSVTTMAWFSLVSVLFTRDVVRRRFLRHGHWIDRALGLVFIALAFSLALSTVKSR
jgi:RhtB (resistance to homoserine/threonine) family protein